MAEWTKYRIQSVNPETGRTHTALIRRDDVTPGTTIDLSPAPIPIEVNYRTNVKLPDWIRAGSACTVRFRDSPGARLTDLLAASDREYKVVLQDNGVTYWTGWFNPESYEYPLFLEGISSIEASDRMSDLSRTAFSNEGVLYTGRTRAIVIIANIMSKLGLGLGFKVHNTWRPHLATNPLDDDDDLLYHIRPLPDVYVDERGTPLTCQAVLDDLLTNFQLQLFQEEGVWCIYPLKKNITIGTEVFTAWLYDAAGSPTGTALGVAHTYMTANTRVTWEKSVQGSGIPPIGQASIVYAHGRPDLWRNLGFDDEGLFDTDAFGWYRSSTIAGITTSSDAHGGTSRSIDMPVNYFEAVGGSIAGGAIVHVYQDALADIGGTEGYRLRFRCQIKMPNRADLPIGIRCKWYFVIRIGSNYFRWSDTTWQASAVKNEIPIDLFIQNADWFEFTTVTPLIDGLIGAPRIEIYQAVEENIVGDAFGQTQFKVLVDSIELDWIDETTQTVVAEATRVTVGIASTTNREEPETPIVLVGEGPPYAYRSNLDVLDSTGAAAGIASDWQRVELSGSTGESDISLHELWADEKLKLYRSMVPTVMGTIIFANNLSTLDLPRPSRLIRFERPDAEVFDSYQWFEQLTWRPVSPRQLMTGKWGRILDGAGGDVFNTGDPNAGLSGGPGTSSGVTQVFALAGARTAEDVDELETLEVGAALTGVVLKSFHAGLDLGGGLFVGEPADVSTPVDGGTVFLAADGRRWKRVIDGPWDPCWFGAKFDAATDDAPAWQATINAAPHGTTIQAPAGLSVIDDTIVLDFKVVTIRGAGESYWAETGYTPHFSSYGPEAYAGTKLYSGPNLVGPMFLVQDTVTDGTIEEEGETIQVGGRRNAVVIERLHLIGNRQPGPNVSIVSAVATDTYGIDIIQGWGVKVLDVNIANFTLDGIRGGAGPATTSDVCHFERVNCADNGGWGVQWNGADSYFKSCRFNFNVSGGALVGSSINTFEACRFDLNLGPGARASGLQFNRFVDCVFDANDANGLHAGDGSTNIRNYVITGCIFANNGKNIKESEGQVLQLRQRAGLWIFGGRGWIISNNVYADYEPGTTQNPKRQTYGLYLSDGWRDHRITGSVFSGNTIGTTNLRTKNIQGVYNVLEHGVEQNTVDCSPALQELIDSVIEGSTLYFPEGNYYLLSTLTISKAIRLVGQSVDDLAGNKGAFIQAAATLDGPCLQISDGGVVVERLNVYGSLSAPSTAATGIEWTLGTGGRVDRCVVANFRGPCIKVGSSAANIWVQNTVAINSETNGILIQGSNCQVSGGEARQNGQYGIYSLGANDTRISDNFVWDNGWDGIIVQDGQRAIVTGNTCRANLLSGIRLRSGSRHMAHNNQCYGNGLDTGATGINRAGIAVIEGDRLSVCHNHCGTNSGGAQQYGISFGDALTSAMVLDNTFEGNAAAQYLWNATSQPGLDVDLFGTVTVDFGSIAAGATATIAVTLNGVIAGDAVMLGPPSNWNTSLQAYGIATGINTVTIVAHNTTGGAINPPSGDWQVFTSRRGGTATAAPPAPTLTPLIIHHFDNPNLLEQA